VVHVINVADQVRLFEADCVTVLVGPRHPAASRRTARAAGPDSSRTGPR
jgi:hypothetical protein